MAHQSIEAGCRKTTWVVLTALMLVFCLGLSSRSHFVVCTGKCCARATANPVLRDHCDSCCCREHAHAKHSDARGQEPGPGSQRRACLPGCCVDLAFDVELAPAPRAVTEHVPNVAAIEPAPVCHDVPTRSWPQWVWPHDTGPPRIDQRTALRASTVLLL
jgi:hypothetical protein